jgi:hypothetical protein
MWQDVVSIVCIGILYVLYCLAVFVLVKKTVDRILRHFFKLSQKGE